MALISNCAEGGTAGVTPTSGNSGGLSGTALTTQTIGSGCTLTFDSAAAYNGALGYRYVQPAGSLSNWQLLPGLSAAGRAVLRFWYRLDSVPTVVEYVCSLRSSAAQVCVLTVGTDGRFVMQNAAGAGITSGANGSAGSSKAPVAIAANTWYRIEISATKGTGITDGQLEYAYFVGDSTTAEFEWTGTTNVNAGTANITSARIGRTTAANQARTADYDSLVLTDLASGWYGLDPVAAPEGLASGEAFGTAVVEVAAASVTLSPSGLAGAEAFGTAAVSTSLEMSPNGVISGEAFGSPVLTSALSVAPAGLAGAEAFGAPTVSTALTVSPSGITPIEAFGAPAVSSALTVSPSGIAGAEAFGTATVSTALTVSPSGTSSAEAFGTAVVNIAALPSTVVPSGIAGSEAFGTPAVTSQLAVSPSGIPSGHAFGPATVTTLLEVSRAGFGTSEAFGSATITHRLPVTVQGIPSGQAFGAASLRALLTVRPPTVINSEVFGTHAVTTTLTVGVAGIGSAEAIGLAALTGALAGHATTSGAMLPQRHGGTIAPSISTQLQKRWEGTLG